MVRGSFGFLGLAATFRFRVRFRFRGLGFRVCTRV